MLHAVTLDSRLLQVERRSAIAHELVHIERGPVPRDPWLAACEELAVEQETARRLIPLDRLVDALAWAHNLHEAADACGSMWRRCGSDWTIHIPPRRQYYERGWIVIERPSPRECVAAVAAGRDAIDVSRHSGRDGRPPGSRWSRCVPSMIRTCASRCGLR